MGAYRRRTRGAYGMRWLLPLLIGALMAEGAFGGAALKEVPYLESAVKAGKLPPVEKRIPDQPYVVEFQAPRQPGFYGGSLKTVMGKAKDIRMMVVYSYARLVGYNERFELVPDLLADIENIDNRIFTLHLRRGHKWSDGHPFTSEDFRYFWEDVANDPDISPFGPPRALLVEDKPPRVEILDRHTVRYSWDRPNPTFLLSLAGSRPLFIYRPAHYLKQFHAKYRDKAELHRIVEELGTRNWAGLHHRKDHPYKQDNPDLPALQPWINSTRPPSEHFVFKRNPYYYRVDLNGRQLPYIDEVFVDISDKSLVPAKSGAGESDLQARYIRFDNYTFLKAGEKRNDYRVRLWRTAKGSQVALFPNLNASDPAWRKLLRDARFRRALSLATYRHEINQVVYFGLASDGNNTLLRDSPLFQPEYQVRWAEFDLEQANKLLDELGLKRRREHGIRFLPDGRPLEIIVDTAGESTEETDVLELIHDSWWRVGVKLFTRPSQREVFRNRIFSGEAIMSVWSGLSNAVPTAGMSPQELAPTTQQHLQWPKWGQYFETNGKAGEAIDMPVARELMDLYHRWGSSRSAEEQERIWHRMLEIHSDQVFSIGTVNGVLQPVVVSNQLHNVPEKGIYNWEPGAYFGIYKLDTFWFSDKRRRRPKPKHKAPSEEEGVPVDAAGLKHRNADVYLRG